MASQFFSIGCGGSLLHCLLAVVSLFAFSSRPSKERAIGPLLSFDQTKVSTVGMCVKCVNQRTACKPNVCILGMYVCASLKMIFRNCFCDYFLRMLPKLKIYVFALALVFHCFLLVVII